jgi:hypothetical protein
MSLRALLIDSGAAKHFIAIGALVLWVLFCAAAYAGLERLFPRLLLANRASPCGEGSSPGNTGRHPTGL